MSKSGNICRILRSTSSSQSRRLEAKARLQFKMLSWHRDGNAAVAKQVTLRRIKVVYTTRLLYSVQETNTHLSK